MSVKGLGSLSRFTKIRFGRLICLQMLQNRILKWAKSHTVLIYVNCFKDKSVNNMNMYSSQFLRARIWHLQNNLCFPTNNPKPKIYSIYNDIKQTNQNNHILHLNIGAIVMLVLQYKTISIFSLWKLHYKALATKTSKYLNKWDPGISNITIK